MTIEVTEDMCERAIIAFHQKGKGLMPESAMGRARRVLESVLTTPPAPVRDGATELESLRRRVGVIVLSLRKNDLSMARTMAENTVRDWPEGWENMSHEDLDAALATPSPDAAVAMGGVTDEAFDAAKSAFLKEYTRQVQTCEVMSQDKQLRAALEAFAKARG